ncbi:hypothetical protein ACWCQ1_41695, partial [Streptomyces sp. NPDC002144]
LGNVSPDELAADPVYAAVRQLPCAARPAGPCALDHPHAENCQGRCLVNTLAARWAVSPRPDSAPGRTLWVGVNYVRLRVRARQRARARFR